MQTVRDVPEATLLWNQKMDNTLLVAGTEVNGVFLSNIASPPTVACGGLCLFATGDLKQLLAGRLPDSSPLDSTSPAKSIDQWMQENFPRLDQLRDAVGPLSLDRYVIVFEDSFFADMISRSLRLNDYQRTNLESVFTECAQKSIPYLEQWLRICRGEPVTITPVYTSNQDVRDLLFDNVMDIGKRTGRQRQEFSKDAINSMYTERWANVLRQVSAITPNDIVMCSEPIQHFVEVLSSNRPGYSGAIQQYLKDNPWGCTGDNLQFSAYGYMQTVITTKAADTVWAKNYSYKDSVGISNRAPAYECGLSKPFPLYENPIARDALNYLFFDRDAMNMLDDVLGLEDERRAARLLAIPPQHLRELRGEYDEKGRNLLEGLSERLYGLYNTLYR